MEKSSIEFIQKTENIADFLKKRNAVKKEFNNDIEILTEKLLAEVDNNKETILFSIPFNETLVTFGRQQISNIFKEYDLPKEGLFLREIKIVHTEYLGDIEFKYCSNIKIQFEFSDWVFNGDISLDCLGFNDEKQRISEQIAGLGFDPTFMDAVKYQEMKDILKKIRSLIKAEKEKS